MQEHLKEVQDQPEESVALIEAVVSIKRVSRMAKTLRIGTRDSALAMWQAQTVQNELNAYGIASELVPVKSIRRFKTREQTVYMN